MPRQASETPHPVDVFVGKRIQTLRLSRGHNQSDLGRALGLTFQQVQKYEKGANRVSASKLWDIARFFNVPFGYFVEGYGEEGTEDGVPALNAVESKILTLLRKAKGNEPAAVVALLRTLTEDR